MIHLFEQDVKTNDRQSSKGNQLKWENQGIWYKADYTGYEGLTEYVVSHLLQKSTLQDREYTLYDLEEINYKWNIIIFIFVPFHRRIFKRYIVCIFIFVNLEQY